MASFVQKYEESCKVSGKQLNMLVEDFIREMQKGLGDQCAAFKMLPSYVKKLPTGEEKGEYVAIDLGGTNFRVVKVVLSNGKVAEVKAVENAIPKECMIGTTAMLFDFIASEVKAFVEREMDVSSGKSVPVGFTFSYPIKQSGIRNGELICWTKGFHIPDTVGKDVVQLMEDSFSKIDLKAHIFAILNDTVGTLAASRFTDQDTEIGVILGTGSNAAYIETESNITKLGSTGDANSKMIINIEWGNLQSSSLPYTNEDRDTDKQTSNAGQQHYEKMISGMYLGEIVRRICCNAVSEVNLFGGHSNVPKLVCMQTLYLSEVAHSLLNVFKQQNEMWSFTTSLVAQIDGLGLDRLGEVQTLLSEALGAKEISETDCKLVIEICTLIGRRSARLAGKFLNTL